MAEDSKAAVTPIDELVDRALARMASGEWRLILEHPNPAEGSSVNGFEIAQEIARRAAPVNASRSGEEPDYWAVHTLTGTHIGLWPNEQHAKDAAREYQGSTIIPLYTTPRPSELVAALRDALEPFADVVSWESRCQESDRDAQLRDVWLHINTSASGLSEFAGNLEAAKAAAQADFERRIRSALTPIEGV